MKKLSSIAALAALAALLSAPLAASAATASGTVNINWNTTVTAALTLNVNYTAAGAAGAAQPATGTGLQSNNNGGAGLCTASAAAFSNTIIDFGTVTADATHATGCLYRNAVVAQVTTNSVSWGLTQQLGAAPANSYLLCGFTNGTYAYGANGAQAGFTTAAAGFQSARTMPAGATCAAAGATAIPSASAQQVVGPAVTTAYSATPAFLGQDVVLITPAAAVPGSQSIALNFTLTAN